VISEALDDAAERRSRTRVHDRAKRALGLHAALQRDW
jgi:hypothetical protein